ncbi:MAG TPA: GNAT family N-acetyltransferase [Streptosporangiaceae bacterium]|nr:GNAT family N-acetyltransferase [Streptosporangiaceae bacterium]
MPGTAELRELSRPDFLASLESLLAVYTAAMQPDRTQLGGRLSIMERHAGYPGFRAIAAVPPGAPVAGALPQDQVLAFAYGFRGTSGQWWHDVVSTAITAASGTATATRWLADSMEIAEVHVRPEHQHQGTGRRLMHTLAAARPERTAVLSTQDSNSPARSLYRSLGFTDLLTGFSFPGGGPPYAVMGAVLPLRGAPAPRPSS